MPSGLSILRSLNCSLEVLSTSNGWIISRFLNFGAVITNNVTITAVTGW